VETIEENERLYTKKQVMAARRVRAYASAMGAMATADIIYFSVEDVVRAYEIYGTDLQAVRGKSVKRKVTKAQEPIGEKFVDSKVIPHIDLMILSGVAFLVGYVKPLCHLL
jgi:transposase